MTAHSLYAKLSAAQAAQQSDLALLIAPRVVKMPAPIARYDDPFLPFGRAIIDATRDLVCAYVFDLSAYLALGAAGAVALERTIPYANADGRAITILHAPFSGTGYVEAASDRAFNVDAVTLVNAADAPAYLAEAGRGVFVMGETAPNGLSGFGYFSQKAFHLFESQQPTLTVRLLDEMLLYTDGKEGFEQTVRALVSAERAKA